MSSKSLHIHFPWALHFKSFKLHHITLYRIVYLNVVVQIVTVSNIIHAGTMNSGSSMSLTFKMMSQVKGISLCREMPKSSWGTDSIYAFTSYNGGSRGGGPPLFLDQTEAQKAEKKLFGDHPPPPPPPPKQLSFLVLLDHLLLRATAFSSLF